MNKLDELLIKMQEAVDTPVNNNQPMTLNAVLKELGLQNKEQLQKCIELATAAKKNKNPSVLDKFKRGIGNALVNVGQKIQGNQNK